MPPAAPPSEPTAPGPPPDPTSEPPLLAPNERPPTRIGRLLAVVFVVGAVGFWFWLIVLAPEQEPRDRLDDPAFAETAEAICTDAREAVDELPAARSAATPQERAVILTDATAIFQTMVDDLRAEAPAEGRDGSILAEWLDDWEVYLGDRTAYADELAAGEDVPFTLTAKAGDQITEAIDGLADANDMDACATPLDV